MTLDEMKAEVQRMLSRNPKPQAIETQKTASEFKVVVKKAQAAKSREKLESALNQLKGYYQ